MSMCACVWVCMRARAHARVYACVSVCVCARMFGVCVYFLRVCVCLYACMFACNCTCISIAVYLRVCVSVCICVCVCLCVHVCVCVYALACLCLRASVYECLFACRNKYLVPHLLQIVIQHDTVGNDGNDGAFHSAVIVKNLGCSHIELIDTVTSGDAIQIKHSKYFPLQAASLKHSYHNI